VINYICSTSVIVSAEEPIQEGRQHNVTFQTSKEDVISCKRNVSNLMT